MIADTCRAIVERAFGMGQEAGVSGFGIFMDGKDEGDEGDGDGIVKIGIHGI